MSAAPCPSEPLGASLSDVLLDLTRQIERDPADAELWIAAAETMWRMGARADAHAALVEAVNHCSATDTLHRARGSLLHRDHRLVEARQAYAQALAERPMDVQTLVLDGLRALDAAELAEAGDRFARVLRCCPGHPDALAGTALVLDRRGDAQAAWSMLAPARTTSSTAFAIATAIVGRHVGRAAEVLPYVERGLDRASGSNRSSLLRAVGDLYDAVDRPDRAWAAWSDANAAQGGSFDPVTHLDGIDAIIAATPTAPPPIGPADSTPVFLVGMPRSGSTLLETLLDGHPRITGAGELDALRTASRALCAAHHVPHPFGMLGQLTSSDARFGRLYLEARPAAPASAVRIIDKMPRNALYLAVVASLLPAARVLWLDRDPDDVAVSCFQKGFSSRLAWSNSVAGIRAWQTGLDRLRAHWSEVLDLPILHLHYEDLVRTPSAVLQRTAAFLDVPYDPGMLERRRDRTIRTASWDQVREPIHTRRIGRGERYRAFLDA